MKHNERNKLIDEIARRELEVKNQRAAYRTALSVRRLSDDALCDWCEEVVFGEAQLAQARQRLADLDAEQRAAAFTPPLLERVLAFLLQALVARRSTLSEPAVWCVSAEQREAGWANTAWVRQTCLELHGSRAATNPSAGTRGAHA